MRNARAIFPLLAALGTAWPLAAPAVAAAQSAPVKMEWLSWSHFRFTSPGGKVILTNPFVTNPDSPIKVGDIAKADVILVADGHPDEVGSTDEIALRTGAKVVAAGEMMRNYFADRKLPPSQFLPMGPSDRHVIDGITIRGVNSVHGSGTGDKGYGGNALGFVIHFENGLTVYFSGSTGLTLDMQLWGSLYKPDVAILNLAQRRDAQEIAHMVRLLRTENPNLKTVIPHHHRLQPPPGAPTVADMETAIRAAGLPVRVLNPELSRPYELTK
jgi:L-ascorbate metabolism protein UlaG (beta-lactamase superfamily)